MTIVFVFKTGFELRMKCEKFTMKQSALGKGYEAKGITENKPIDFDFDDILCIYRVVSDEDGEKE